MRVRESYSIVISPREKDVSSVKDMKGLLFKAIGMYGSRNSEAHITIVTFKADPPELDKVIRYVNTFCLRCSAENLEFVKFASFSTTFTFYLESSSDTQEWFKELVKRFNKQFPLNKTTCEYSTSSKAHITIGRKLNLSKLGVAHHLFKNQTVDIVFPCKSMVIRKFNPDIGQYEALSHHLFGNKTDLYLEDQQLSLF